MRRVDLIIELAAWNFDENPERRDVASCRAQTRAEERVASPSEWDARAASVEEISADVQKALCGMAERDDLEAEFQGLDWRLGVVDLRRLVSFQRRLVLRDEPVENENVAGWAKRIDLAFPPHRSSSFTHTMHPDVLTLSSENPDFTARLRATADDAELFGLAIHHGSPFMELGVYRGRWFLRDGYHRAHRVLRAGVFEMPAVIVQAKTLEELGANQPWFFPEEILFSARPPLVTDFLCDDLVLRWCHPARRKRVRVTITEDFEPSCLEEGEGTEDEYCNQAR